MKKLLFAVAFLFLSNNLYAQPLKSGTISTAGADCTVATNCLEIDNLRGIASIGVRVNVGTSGTFNFEASIAEGVYFSVPDDVNASSSVTADAERFFSNPGYSRLRVRASAISGNATVFFYTGYVGLRSTATLSGASQGDGAIQDGANATIEATVADLANSNPLIVRCATSDGTLTDCGGGSGGAAQADNTALANITGSGALFDTTPPAITDGNVGIFRMGSDRILLTNTTITAAIPAGTNNIGDVDVLSIAAGNNNIGDVDIASISAGDNNIGNVDVVTLPAITGTVTANAGTDLNTSALLTTAGFNTVLGSSTLITATQADNLANSTDTANVSGFTYVFDGTTWDRWTGSVSVSNTVTVDSELLTAAAAADNTANPTAGGVLSFNMCFDGSTWDRCLTSLITEATHDGALTVGSTVSAVSMFRASASAPANVDASNDAVLGWALQNGSQVVNLASGGTLLTGTGTSLNVNCTGGCASTSIADDSTFTFAVTTVVPIAGVLDNTGTDSVDENDVGAIRMSANRNLFTTLRDAAGNERGANVTAANALVVDGSAVTQPVSQSTASNLNAQVVGAVAFDAAAASVNPVLIGTYASQAAPTDVSADNDSVRLWALRNGSLVTNLASGGTLITSTGSSLNVVCTSGCGGSGGTSMTDDAAFTVGATAFSPIGGTYKSVRDLLDDNDAGAFAMNQRRGIYASLETPNSDSVADDTLDTLKVSQATAANLNATVVGTGTFSVQSTSVIPGTGATNLGKAIDTAFGSTDTIVGVGYVRDDALATLTPAESDWTNGRVNAYGAQWTMGDLCGSDAVQSVVVNSTASGNTELVAISGSTVVYVCGYNFMSSGTADVRLVRGTGTACATGETGLTGLYPLTAQTGISVPNGGAVQTKGASGDAVCIESSAAVNVRGMMTYVQR